MSWLKKYQNDLLVITVVLIYSLIVWWPTKTLAYHWDSAGFVINSARKLLETNFNPLIVPDSDFAHPPLLIAALALSWKIFGQNFLVSHLLMFPFLPLFLTAVYFLLKKISNFKIALGSTILCAATPVVIAEYGLIYIDLPMATLTTAGLAFWVKEKKWLATILFTLAALIKLPALTIVGGLMLWHLLKKEYRKLPILLIPFIVFALWLFYHYRIEGWLIARPGRLFTNSISITSLFSSSRFVFSKLFIEQGRIWITASALFSLFYLLITKGLKKSDSMPFLMTLLLSGLPIFIITGEFGSRYGIFLLPLFYGLSLELIFRFFKAVNMDVWLVPLSLIIAFILSSYWHPMIKNKRNYVFAPPEDLSYQDMIIIGKQLGQFSQKQFPHAFFYGAFPESYQLTQAYQGYVDQTLNFSDCSKFSLIPDKQQIIIFHPYSPIQLQCEQILQRIAVQPLAQFEKNGKWLQLYLVNATESAKL